MKKLIALLSAFAVIFSSVFTSIVSFTVFAQSKELLISDCETLDGWTKSGGNSLSLNNNGFTGKSVACDINNGAFRSATFTAATPLDVSAYQNIEWDVMMHTGGKTGMWDEIKNCYGDEVYLKIGSSSSDYNVYRLSKMTVEQDDGNSLWNHFSVEISNPSSTSGSFDATKMTLFYFTTIDGAVNSSVRNGHIRIDNIYARNLLSDKPEEIGDLVLSECETTDNWNYANAGMMSLTTNGMTGSAVNINTSYGAFRKLTFTKDFDISNYNTVEFDLFCMKVGDVSHNMWSDITASYGDKIAVEVSDGTNTNTYGLNKWNVTELGNNWIHVSINLNNYSSGSKKFNLGKFKTFSVYSNITADLDKNLPNTTFRIDNLIARFNAEGNQPSLPGDDPDGVWSIPGNFEKTTTGTFSFIIRDFNLDLSKYQKSDLHLTMRVFVENKNGSENILDFTSDGQIELTSSGDCDKQEANWSVPKLGLKSGWNDIRLLLSSAANDTGLNLSNINYFRFYSRKAGEDQFNVKIEDIKITNIKEESIVGTYFSDGMMFTQNKPMKVFGNVEKSGLKIIAKLKDKNGILEEKVTQSSADGSWNLSFSGRKGGYDKYSIEIYVADQLKKTIKDILIGELWLAAGQSNMEYFVLQTIPDYDYDLIPLNEYVRFFDEPLVPGGVNSTLPSSPATDIDGAKWANGSNAVDVKYVSAIAYYMSLQLQNELNIPIGFINAAKGASVIESWLPREVIENDSVIKSTLKKRDIYKTATQLDKTASNWTYLTTLYNSKIAPLAGVEISGMLWYQGESNIKYADENGYNTFYKNALMGLIESYGNIFGYNGGEMPFVCAHLAPYNYSSIRSDYETVLASFSEMLTDIAGNTNARMIQIPIYDLSLNYKNPPINNPDPIHPNSKSAVASRFADAVLSEVYGIGDKNSSNAPIAKSYKINGSKIEITFDNVGGGLKSIGDAETLHGFAICGNDRTFVKADAEIISKNTVAVYSEKVSLPTAATYAWSSFNMNSNLCNSAGIPAVPYRTDKTKSVYYLSMDWGYCDFENVWDAKITLDAGFKPSFNTSQNAVVSFVGDNKIEGKSAAKLTYTIADSKTAVLSPVLNYGGMVNNYPNYSGITLNVKNYDGNTNKLSVEIVAGGESYKASVTEGEKLATEYDLVKGSFREYTFNFTRLVDAEGKVLRDSKTVLKMMTALNIIVADDKSGEVLFDNIYLRADKLPAPGAENDKYADGIADTSPGSFDSNGNVWLSDADSTTGWSVSGTQLEVDKTNKTQGTASVGAVGKDGILKQITFSTGKGLDISDYQYLEFDVYFSNLLWFNACESMMFELTSSGGSDNESDRYMKGYISNNLSDFYDAAVSGTTTGKWYHIKLVLGVAQTQARGGMNMKNFNYFRFFTVGAKDAPDFIVRFDNMKFTKDPSGNTEIASDPSYGKNIDDNSMWMTDCDSPVLWTATGTDVVIDKANKTQGNASVGVTAKGGVLKQLAFIPKKAINISDYQYLEFDVFFSNLDWYKNCKGTMFELTSAGTCDKESNRYTKSSMLEASPSFAADIESGKSGGKWYHFKLNLDRPHSSVKGGLNKSEFDYFRFYSVDLKSGTSDYTIRFDNMKFTKGEKAAAIIKTDKYLIINNGDSAAGWSSPGQEVMTDSKNKTEGKASVSVTAKNGILKELTYRPSKPIDLTGYNYLKFDLFLSDISCISTSTGLMVELTSSGTCDNASNRYMKSAILSACPELATDLANGVPGNKWYSFCFNLSKPQNRVRGGLNFKAFNYFRIYFIGSPDTTPDCVVNIDNLRVTTDGISKEANGAGSNKTISFGNGSDTNYKNIGNKINGGLAATPLTEYPVKLMLAVKIMAIVSSVLAVSLIAVSISYFIKRKI